MPENHFRSHFSPFQINHFWLHFSPYQINTQLFVLNLISSGHFRWSTQACPSYFHKMAAILVFRFSPKSIGFSTLGHQWLCQIWIWYEHWCRGGGDGIGVRRRRRRPDQNHNIPEISNFRDIINCSKINQRQMGDQQKLLVS